MLARLSELPVAECKLRLERGWRLKAPRALVKEHDAARAKGAPTSLVAERPATDRVAKRQARKAL